MAVKVNLRSAIGRKGLIVRVGGLLLLFIALDTGPVKALEPQVE